MDVKNILNFKRPKVLGGADSVTVNYPEMIEHMELPFDYGLNKLFPWPTALGNENNSFINKYNLCAHGFINGRRNNALLQIARQVARPINQGPSSEPNSFTSIGAQNRYYLSAVSTDGQDTLDFVHAFLYGGVQFVFDFANKARRSASTSEWGNPDGTTVPFSEYTFTKDFKPGDKAVLKTFGGALGMPLPGAKVRVKISEAESPDNKYTDGMLDGVKVVPNPYYLSHQAQKSAYDAKIFFTRLPKRCTIEIYTINGDLIKRLEHEEIDSPDATRAAVEVWDLLSRNQQRVDSQTLVALIKTPDGAQAVKKFSIVVGGFRVVSE
jgi:hypothetical protein